MFHCTFLVNRQMITHSGQIESALRKYETVEGGNLENFIYRLEWYRIGVSISMDVYCDKEPILSLVPECQLQKVEELESLPSELKEINFKIFIIPYKTADKNEDLDADFIKTFIKKELKGAAEIVDATFGPNNRIYYKGKKSELPMEQIQSYSLQGILRVIEPKKLDKLRRKSLGYYSNLGCGMLFLY